ncbi:MAG TPA: FxDxF family PEP-CTERM protein [Ideonella sp.]|uniref:FxDxF family PEP-CTERM protein n=1 Tax=Ideonella sp. TaxID=1929293 RepID=UPI002C050C28|nr:FxDxF family PEP-CTERM protein [Ideonella sp.]HSI50552.1 FxDxF family PEP-CTERM protein [Ideonella sp.]
MKLKPLLASLALAGASLASQATTYSLGVLPIAPAKPAIAGAVVSPGSFSDWWSFSLPTSASFASFATTSITLGGTLFDIAGLSLGVYTAIGSGYVTGGSTHLSNVGLTAGQNYYLNVTGTATGLFGGSYALIAAAAPVPEPTPLVLLGLGLAVLGWAGRRKSEAATGEAQDLPSGGMTADLAMA